MLRSRATALLLLLLMLILAGCAATTPITGQRTSGLDRKLSTYAFIEEGNLLTLIVDTRATGFREDAAYIPLEIAVANRGLRSITLTAESFTLIDSDGNRYPMASPRELLEGYEFLEFDRLEGMAELEGLIADKFAAFTRYESSFSPNPGAMRGIVQPTTHIPKFGYIVDLIYFPTPPSGIKGRTFELFVDAAQLEDPVFSRFEVR